MRAGIGNPDQLRVSLRQHPTQPFPIIIDHAGFRLFPSWRRFRNAE
jgi:hypothetical protein